MNCTIQIPILHCYNYRLYPSVNAGEFSTDERSGPTTSTRSPKKEWKLSKLESAVLALSLTSWTHKLESGVDFTIRLVSRECAKYDTVFQDLRDSSRRRSTGAVYCSTNMIRAFDRSMNDTTSNTPSKAPGRYRAPALAKGLEILELLASSPDRIPLVGICEKLSRSRNEIFRMVQELDAAGYIRKGEQNDGYELTQKLLKLGLEQPRNKSLLETALPYMRKFSNTTGNSCHLAIRADELIIVIARIEAPGPVSFSIRVGHRRPIADSTSGIILFAGQTAQVQAEWSEIMRTHNESFDEAQFMKRVSKCAAQGFVQNESRFIDGVTDIAAPIRHNGTTIASLTSSCLFTKENGNKNKLPVSELLNTAAVISDNLSATASM